MSLTLSTPLYLKLIPRSSIFFQVPGSYVQASGPSITTAHLIRPSGPRRRGPIRVEAGARTRAAAADRV